MANRTIVKGNIGNALHSVAPDHITTTADEVFDETSQQYQSEINQAKADKAPNAVAGHVAVFDNNGNPVDGGILTEGVYDVSENNPTAGPNNDGKFTLEYILNQNNVNTLIPAAYRKGGMSIKFIQSSDNKYVQYRYMLNYENTPTGNQAFMNAVNWQGVTDEVQFENNDIVTSGSVYEKLYGNTQKESIIATEPLYGEHLAFSKVIPAGAVIDSIKIPAEAIVYLAKTNWTYDSNIQLNSITLPYTTQYDYIGVLSSRVGNIELTYHIEEKKYGIVDTILAEENRAKGIEAGLRQDINDIQGVIADVPEEINAIELEINGSKPVVTTENVSTTSWYEHSPFSKTMPSGSVITKITTIVDIGNTYLARSNWSYDAQLTLDYIRQHLPYTTTEDYIGLLTRLTGNVIIEYNDGSQPVEGINDKIDAINDDIDVINDKIDAINDEMVQDVQEIVPHTYPMPGGYSQATMFETPLPAGTVIRSMSGIAAFYFTNANGAYHTPLIDTSQKNLVLSQTEYGVISNPSGTLTLNIVETIKKQKTEIIDEEIAVINTNIEDLQSELLGEIDIICPTNLYAMVGKDFNLYYDSLFKAMDNGLQSPFGYYVEINCATLWTKSIRKDRCWQIQGSELTSASIGQHSATINVYNHKSELSGTKNVTINVIDNQGLVSPKNILLIGDSLTYNGSLAKRVNNNIVALGGDTPNMVGTVLREGYYSEGRPGWTAIDFVSAKQNGYHIFFITISANVSVGDKYTDGTTQYTVADIRIEGDTKSLRCTGSAEPSSTTGTLTKVSGDGDSSITYNNYIHENGNPLYNNTTELIDFTNYREIINLGSQFDVIVIMLGVNDCLGSGNLSNSVAAIKTLTEKALEDSPNCKVIVELTTLDANTVSSWQAYGSLASKHHYQERVWQLRKLLMNETFAANVIIGTCGLSIDRYYGYPYTTAQCSQRITETEILHTNCVHPSNAGYNQIADCYVAEILS